MSLLGEIKRRRVVQVGVLYGVVAWALVEIVATIEEPLGLPTWVDTLVIVLALVGFPLAMILSWAFDVTPQGVVRTPSTDEPEASASAQAPPFPAAPSAGVSAESPAPKPAVLRNSVAILPLENLSPNPDDAYFAAGIHEEILNYVAKIQDVNVIARTSVKRYAGSDKPIGEIAAELGVGTIMEGSVRYAGERVRVTAQLIDAATENHLWSDVYERELADIFAIQADIAENIAAALEAELSSATKKKIETPTTESPEAYALYLRAMAIIQEYGWSNASVPEVRVMARSWLDQAIAADADFALAYVQRGRLLGALLNQDPGELENYEERRAEMERLALADLEKAMQLDPSIGAAHAAMARIHQFNWRGKEAAAEYALAMELSPNDPITIIDFAIFTAITGNPARAVKLAQRSASLNPNDAQVHMGMSMIHLHNADVESAVETERRSAELAPSAGLPHVILGHLEKMTGNHTEALKQARIAEELLRDDMNPTYLGELICVYARLDMREDAERLFGQVEDLAKKRRVPALVWLLSYMALGDDEQAYRWLKTLVKQREPYVSFFSTVNHVVGNIYRYPLLDEPRVKALRDGFGFQDLRR
ncbi:MAG TPA: hypothetical protein VIV14_07925 [Gammaproteobacteria bacterium]